MGDKKICCVVDQGTRCVQVASSFSFTKRARRKMQAKAIEMSVDESVGHTYVCLHHRGLINTLVPANTSSRSSDKRKRRTPEDDPIVNFNALSMTTLKRYKKHYKLEDKTTKAELASVIAQHFSQQHVVELDTLVLFSHMVKQRMNKS